METIPTRTCTYCGYIHPPPWDKLCPQKIRKEATIKGLDLDLGKFIIQVAQDLSLINNPNLLKETMDGIKSAINIALQKNKMMK